MAEFEEYLARIRAALDVSPRRADEICAEVRTHLEERARQLVESGASREEAVAVAARDFGDATDVARRLAAANRGHRSVTVLRVLLAFVVAFVGMLVSFGLLEGNAPGIKAVAHWLWEQSALLGGGLTAIVMALLMAPAALAAGMLAGRRWWWVSGVPMGLFGAAELIIVEPPAAGEYAWGVTMLVVGGPMLAWIGFLGSRLPRGRSRWYATAGLGVGYFLGLGMVALLVEARGEMEFLMAAAIGMLVLGVLGTAALWQAGKRWHRLAVLATVLCAGCLWAVVKLTNTWFSRLPPRVTYPLWPWRGLVAAEGLAVLLLGVAVLVTWRRSVRGESQAVPLSS